MRQFVAGLVHGARAIALRGAKALRAALGALVSSPARVARALAEQRAAAARRIERTARLAAVRIASGVARAERIVRQAARFARRAAFTAAAVLVVSTALATAALATTTLYSQFGAPRAQANAVSWADRTPTYGRVDCRQCHSDEATATATEKHSSLVCESCHTPTVLHPGTTSGVVNALPIPSSTVCGTCHDATSGRPAGFPEIDVTQHYEGADCLRCHDPHTSRAVAPPVVTHPLADLPACTTCHSPVGLKRYPAGHQPAADAVCLSCHKPRTDPS